MEMTIKQKKLFELGKEAKKITGDMSFKSALRYLYLNNEMVDVLDDLPENKDRQFFEAGFYGFEPQWRQGFRYGNIPGCGYSTNWGTGETEKGISCIYLIGGKNANSEIYDNIYTAQGFKKIKVEGWFLGDAGSDGEPLLIQAMEVK